MVVVGRLLLLWLWLIRVLLVGGRLCRTLLSILGAPSKAAAAAIIVIFDRQASIQKGSLKMTPVSTDLLLTSSYSCREGSTARLREKRRGCASASEDGCLVSLRTTPAAESLASVRRTDDTHTHTHGGGGGIGSDCSTDRI